MILCFGVDIWWGDQVVIDCVVDGLILVIGFVGKSVNCCYIVENCVEIF